MKALETQQHIAESLAQSEALTAADCQRLIVAISQAQAEVGERVARTKPADDRSGPGAERQAALTRGTPEDVAKVEAEHAQATTLAAQLAAQRGELDRLKTAAKLREAFASLPTLQSELADRVAAAEAALAALQSAMGEVRSTATTIHHARGTIRHLAGQEPEGGASRDLLARLSTQTMRQAFALGDGLMATPGATDWASLVGVEPAPLQAAS